MRTKSRLLVYWNKLERFYMYNVDDEKGNMVRSIDGAVEATTELRLKSNWHDDLEYFSKGNVMREPTETARKYSTGPQFHNRKIISDCPRCERRKIVNRLTQDEIDVMHLMENHTVHKCPNCSMSWTCVGHEQKQQHLHDFCLACMVQRAGLKPLVARCHTI